RWRRSWCSEWASESLNFEVVRVVAAEIGADADEDGAAASRDEPAFDQLHADPRARLVEVVAKRDAQRNDAPVEREPARRIAALGGGDDRRARSKRRQSARSRTAASHGNDRLGVAAIRQRQ